MSQERERTPSRMPRYVGEMVDWLDAMIVTIFCIVLIFTFAFRMVGVEGTSMLDTLQNKDKVILSNLFYTPEKGDIVVISRTNQHLADGESKEPLIKRIIALEGDEVDIHDGAVYVNGEKLSEQEGEHIFKFRVKLNGETKVQAVAGDSIDDAVFRKVDAPNPDYKLTKKKSTSANWV